MTKRTIIGLAISALVCASIPVYASAASKSRTEEARYEFDPTQQGLTGWFGDDYGLFFGDPVEFSTKRKDTHAEVTVTDDSGSEITAAIWQEGGDTTVICGGTSPHLEIRGGKALYVQVFVDVTFAAFDGCDVPALPSSGTITTTLMRHKSKGQQHHH